MLDLARTSEQLLYVQRIKKIMVKELKADMIKLTHQIVNINKDIRIIKKKKQMDILELRSTRTEILKITRKAHYIFKLRKN